jgi:Fe2+ transport system protein FeoA
LREVDEGDQGVCLSPFWGELRTRREEWNLNGVKNLLRAKTVPKTLLNHRERWDDFITFSSPILIFFSRLIIIKSNINENYSQFDIQLEKEKMMSLAQAPPDTPLKIVEIFGGHGVRRRLFALGFHKNDLVELNSQGLFRGPILVRNLTLDISVALGRGIAQKIIVEVVDEKK